jgi:hypothetical protein
VAKNQFDSPPLLEDKESFREYMLQLHNDVYGIGEDTEGSLTFPDNIIDVPNVSGTTQESFTIDSDDTGGDVSLIFGTTLAESLIWDDSDSQFVLSDDLKIEGNLITTGGRRLNETRYTSADTILSSDDIVWGDTDGGAFTLTLHDGVGGDRHEVTNSGNSNNALTVASHASDTIDGGASLTLYDGETAIIHFNSTDNEWKP